MDTLRGPDSTGIFCVDKDGYTTMLKDDVPGWDMLMTKEYLDHVDKPMYKSGKVVVGHNRKATVGKVNAANAHPFTVNKEFVLVHNGSLSSHKHLGHDADVDSHAVAKYLHDKWNDDATPDEIAELFAHIGGAWALVWYDLRFEKLYFIRNSQRPLALVETASEWFFASELEMLKAGLSRNTLTITNTVEVKPYVLYSVNLGATEVGGSKVQEVVLPTAPFFPTTKANTKHGGSTTTTTECKPATKNHFKKFCKNKVGQLINFYVEDFVDVNHSEPQNYYFYGENYEYNFDHEIVGVTSEDIATSVIGNYNCAQARVVNVEYDKAGKRVQFQVELLKVENETTVTH